MDCSKEVAKRIYSSGITFLLAPGAGGVSQVLMACSKSLVSWSQSRGGHIHLVRFFVMFNNYQKAHTGVWSLELIHSHYHMRNPVLNYRTIGHILKVLPIILKCFIGLGKRGGGQYSFGLGKRGSQYSFGLG